MFRATSIIVKEYHLILTKGKSANQVSYVLSGTNFLTSSELQVASPYVPTCTCGNVLQSKPISLTQGDHLWRTAACQWNIFWHCRPFHQPFQLKGWIASRSKPLHATSASRSRELCSSRRYTKLDTDASTCFNAGKVENLLLNIANPL